jgi:hypothetical protein
MTVNGSFERGNPLGNNGNRRIRIVGMLAADVSLCMVLTLEWLSVAVLTVLAALVRTKKGAVAGSGSMGSYVAL